MLIHLFVGKGKMGLLKTGRLLTGFHLMITISPIAREGNRNFILALRSDDQFRHMPLMTATTLVPLQSRAEVTLFIIPATELWLANWLANYGEGSLADSLFSLYFAVSFVFSSGNVQCTTFGHLFTATRKIEMRQALANMAMARNWSGNHYELYQ